MDARSQRRQQAQEDLGLTSAKEQKEIQKAIDKEEQRRQKKEQDRMRIEESTSYRMTVGIAKYMDKYYIDPIVGFIFPGAGDFLTSVFVVPYIYVSLVHIRSIPLTLAVIFNILKDILIGLIPFYIGAVCDFLNRGYLQNMRLISGFVEDDKEIINDVNKKAVWMAILIVVFCFLIYLLVGLIIKLAEEIGSLWDWLIGLIA